MDNENYYENDTIETFEFGDEFNSEMLNNPFKAFEHGEKINSKMPNNSFEAFEYDEGIDLEMLNNSFGVLDYGEEINSETLNDFLEEQIKFPADSANFSTEQLENEKNYELPYEDNAESESMHLEGKILLVKIHQSKREQLISRKRKVINMKIELDNSGLVSPTVCVII